MSRIRKITLFLLALGCCMQGDPLSYVLKGSFTSTAEAIIGRPATPLSYAGVARRTARRGW